MIVHRAVPELAPEHFPCDDPDLFSDRLLQARNRMRKHPVTALHKRILIAAGSPKVATRQYHPRRAVLLARSILRFGFLTAGFHGRGPLWRQLQFMELTAPLQQGPDRVLEQKRASKTFLIHRQPLLPNPVDSTCGKSVTCQCSAAELSRSRTYGEKNENLIKGNIA